MAGIRRQELKAYKKLEDAISTVDGTLDFINLLQRMQKIPDPDQ